MTTKSCYHVAKENIYVLIFEQKDGLYQSSAIQMFMDVKDP